MDKKPEKLVPEVRFKGFTDDWEQHKLGEVVSVFDGTHQTPNYKTKGIMFLSVENINTLLSNKYISENEYRQRFKIKPQYLDVFMTRIGTIGKTNVITTHKPIAYYVSLALLRPQNIQSFFLSFIIQTSKVQQDIWKRTLQIAFPQKINKDEIGKVTLALPLQKEQIDIEKLLLKLDKLITLQQRKLEQLKQLKKVMLQQMFADPENSQPVIQFSEFCGDWEHHKLNEYLKVSKIRNKGNIYTRSDVLSVSGNYGVINQIAFQGRSFAGKNLENYKVVNTSDVIYTKSPLKESPYGIIKTNMGTTGIVSTLYAVYKTNRRVNSRFIEYYFDNLWRLNKYLKPIVNIGAKHSMGISDVEAINHFVLFPKKIEQSKIAKIIYTQNNLINLQQNNLNQLTTLKNYLLQKLFI